MRLRGRLGALQEPQFRRLWLGQTTSSVGDSLIGVALAFAVFELGGSAGELGLVLAALTLSRVTFLLAGGVWADRLPRRLVMLAADGVRAVAQATVAVLLITGAGEIWHLVAVGFVSGAASAFFIPAAVGLVPDTVSGDRLQQANATMALSRNATEIFGPALSGALVAGVGPGWVFAIDAATYAVSAATLVRLRVRPGAALELKQSFFADLRDGWREVTSRRWILIGLAADAVSNVGMAAFYVLGPVVAEEELGGAADWGLIVAAGAVGGTIGSVLALRIRPRYPLRLGYPLVVLAAPQLLALVTPLPVAAIAAASLLAYAGISLANTLVDTVYQQHVPRAALSRVSSYDWLISLTLRPLALAVIGPAAVVAGQDAVLIVAAALLFVGGFGPLAAASVRMVARPVATEAA